MWGGNPKSMTFRLTPNPVSLLNARPTVWLEADVAFTRLILEHSRKKGAAAAAP